MSMARGQTLESYHYMIERQEDEVLPKSEEEVPASSTGWRAPGGKAATNPDENALSSAVQVHG
jgi:hypothetical protein